MAAGMGFPRLPLCLAAFGAGLAAVFWIPGNDRAPSEISGADAREKAGTSDSGGQEKPLPPPNPSAPVDSNALPEAALLLAGLKEPPDLEIVLSSPGLERRLRLNLFLRGQKTPADLAAALDRCGKEVKPDPELIDLIWLRWVEIDLPSALERSGSGGRGWWAFGKKDPAGALEAAARADSPQALAGVIQAIAENDPAEGARLTALHPESASREVWSSLTESLGRENPAEAVAVALRKNLPLDRIAADWMARDPQAAMAWSAGLPEASDRRKVTAELIRQLSRLDPEAALREASRLPPGRENLTVFNDTLTAMAARDPAKALSLAAAQPAGYARESAYAVMARGLASTDADGALKAFNRINWPEAAAFNEIKWSIQFGGDPTLAGDQKAEAESGPAYDALAELMRAAPGRTASALAALPPEAKAPLTAAMDAWLSQDPEGASQWIRDQPPGPARNGSIELLAHWLIEGAAQPDFEAAMAWAEASTAANREELIRWIQELKEPSANPQGDELSRMFDAAYSRSMRDAGGTGGARMLRRLREMRMR